MLIESALPRIHLGEVAHYTRIGTLCSFVRDNNGWSSARTTPVQFLNDRLELLLGLDILQEVADTLPKSNRTVRAIIEELLTTPGTLETDAFQMSFSGNPDELGQWRGNAANGMGCSVITRVTDVEKVANVAGWVIYDAKKQRAFARKVLAHLRHTTDHDYIAQLLVAAASYMKHEGFMPEMEFRLLMFPKVIDVQFRESGERLVPFFDYLSPTVTLPIEKIIIGPGWQLSKLRDDE